MTARDMLCDDDYDECGLDVKSKEAQRKSLLVHVQLEKEIMLSNESYYVSFMNNTGIYHCSLFVRCEITQTSCLIDRSTPFTNSIMWMSSALFGRKIGTGAE